MKNTLFNFPLLFESDHQVTSSKPPKMPVCWNVDDLTCATAGNQDAKPAYLFRIFIIAGDPRLTYWGLKAGHCQQAISILKQERLKRRNTLGCLDQYAAQNSKYARPPIPSQPSTQKVFFLWHTQYDPTMNYSHCKTVYAKELFQWLFFELVHSFRIL